MADNADDKKAPVLQHLEELRWRIIWSLLALVVGIGAGWFFAPRIFRFLVEPLASLGVPITQIGVTQLFMSQFRLGAYAGLVLASPIILYQLLAFVLPALTPSEKRVLFIVLPSGLGLFALGAAFAYGIVVPYMLNFFIEYSRAQGMEPIVPVNDYLDLLMTLTLPIGLIFEMPLLVGILARLGLVTARFLARFRKFALLLIIIAAAALTPTTDMISQVAFALPMLGLYEVSIWVARILERKRAQ